MNYHTKVYRRNVKFTAFRFKMIQSLRDEGVFEGLLEAKDFIEGKSFETDSLDTIRIIQKIIGEDNMWVDVHDHEQMKLDEALKLKDKEFLDNALKWYDGLSQLEKEYFKRLTPTAPGGPGG